MKTIRGTWLFLIPAIVVLSSFGGCSDDDPSTTPSGNDSGADVAVDQHIPDTGIDRHAPDAGDTGPAPCGVAADPDPSPKVRLVNLLLSSVSSGRPLGVGDPPAVRLHANGAAVQGLVQVASGRGSASVTNYAKVAAGTVTFSAEGDAADGGAPYKLSTTLSIAAGARVTLFAIGNPGSTRDEDKARLVHISEGEATAPCNEVKLRFLHADYGLQVDSFFVDGKVPEGAALRFAEASPPIARAVNKMAIAIRTSTATVVGPTEQAPFSVPSSAFAGGRSYYVISAGEPARWTDDERNHTLLILPIGDDTPAVSVKRDPLVFFFHASPDAPPDLEVHAKGAPIALSLKYAQAPTFADFAPGATTLAFAQAGAVDAGNPTVLDNQSTGELVPGGFYLGGILGLAAGTGAQGLQSKIWKLDPPPALDTSSKPRSVVIHASPTAPAVDVGYWPGTTAANKGSPYTPRFTNVTYGSATAATGTDWEFPSSNSARRWLGVQPTGDESTNRSRWGIVSQAWTMALLLGDWNAPAGATQAQLVLVELRQVSTARAFPLPRP